MLQESKRNSTFSDRSERKTVEWKRQSFANLEPLMLPNLFDLHDAACTAQFLVNASAG